MKGLILDTSTKNAIVGVVKGNSLESVLLLDGGRGLSSSLLPAIAPLIPDLSFIAVGIGPGSHMGVRTGATVAMTLAYSKNIPLIEFSSILVSLPRDLSAPFVFVSDAKMGEYLLIEGIASEGKVRDLSAPRLVPHSELEQELPKGREVIGREPIKPHLYWVTLQVTEALVQNQTLSPEGLSLSYLR